MGLTRIAPTTIAAIFLCASYTAAQLPFEVTCKDGILFGPGGQFSAYTFDDLPLAAATGGLQPYSYSLDVNAPFTFNGYAPGSGGRRITATDVVGRSAACTLSFELRVQDAVTGDPHMLGLRGQKIDWSGVDGGWYSMIKDEEADLHINLRLTAPLPDDFPNRQLVTGISVMSEGHSLAIEVKNPYTIATGGCPQRVSPCLAHGGLRAIVDGKEVDDLLRFSTEQSIANGIITFSASNLPFECRQFGGDKIWARMYEEKLREGRVLGADETFEDWILSFRNMAAPEWCMKYIAENDLADLQSAHAICKIDTPSVTVRLNAGVNYQGDGDLDWDGRTLPDLEFWQMDVGLDGLNVENPALSGILGETARPVYDATGHEVMEGFEAFRGDVEDYRVSGSLGTHFTLLDKKEEHHK